MNQLHARWYAGLSDRLAPSGVGRHVDGRGSARPLTAQQPKPDDFTAVVGGAVFVVSLLFLLLLVLAGCATPRWDATRPAVVWSER